MDISLGLSVAVMLVGLVLYLVSAPAKPQEIGRLMFAFGLLAALLRFAGSASLHVG
jgi:hypothetical protein